MKRIKEINEGYIIQIFVALMLLVVDIFAIAALAVNLERDNIENVITLVGVLIIQTPVIYILLKTRF